MAIYSYVSFSQAQQELANRLYDPGMAFWTSTELGKYIREALHTWNALTNYWRNDFIFTPAAGITWYDLTALPNSLRPYTLKDSNLYLDIQYALLEPASGVNPWTGASAQFSADDLINALLLARGYPQAGFEQRAADISVAGRALDRRSGRSLRLA